MHPVLLQIGKFTIYSYGLLVVLGFVAGIGWAALNAGGRGIEPGKVLDLSFYLVIAAIIGARFFYVLVEFKRYLKDPVDIFRIWEGGFVFYGGLISAGIVGTGYILYHHLPHWQVMDLFAPGIALGQAIGRLGCFCAGCCYGKECHCSFGVVFRDSRSLAVLNAPLYPTQLISSLNLFVIFFVLVWVDRKKRFDGQVFWIYVLLYAIMRFAIEFLRGDPRGYIIPGFLSTSQGISLILIPVSLYFLARLKRQGGGY